MANSNTSLNGYEFGREPKTQAPFWGAGGEGAEIDDTTTSTTKTWSSKKISDELNEKADASDTYTKSEVDDLISGATPVPTDSYTKAETDELLESYAKVTSVYTKSQTYTKAEVDALVQGGGTPVDAYTKAETDALLDDKADADSVYTKTQTDSLIDGCAKATAVYTKSQTYTKAEIDALIPDTSGLATKTEVNTGLASKADADSVYTKSQTDGLIDSCAKATAVYTKSQTYTKAEVDALVQGGGTPVDAYTKAETDALLADKADVSELASYAKVTSVYTKSQTYTKAEVDALIPDTSGLATKTEVNTGLASKANSADVYTKSQTDNLLADKADVTDLASYATATSVYTKAQTYSKTEVDNLISQAGGGGAEIDDTTTSTTKVWSSSKVSTELATKAGVSASACSRARTFTSTNYGLTTAPVDGEDYSAFVQLNINGSSNVVNKFYVVPYNGVTTTPTANEVAAGPQPYRWLEIPVTVGTKLTIIKVCLINYNTYATRKQPYMFVLYDSSIITSLVQVHNETQMTKIETGGSSGLSFVTTSFKLTVGDTDAVVLNKLMTKLSSLNIDSKLYPYVTISGLNNGTYRLVSFIDNTLVRIHSEKEYDYSSGGTNGDWYGWSMYDFYKDDHNPFGRMYWEVYEPNGFGSNPKGGVDTYDISQSANLYLYTTVYITYPASS